ncbi:LuxR C-terminal-related transcriptional regulator [Kitasatospora purpeofusca]|uniref:LuxR C-terminal-related transcriptional regulator n=1 Tax=Kitasatospora purpeofusca TaxID=67352 RepID=UPI0036931737
MSVMQSPSTQGGTTTPPDKRTARLTERHVEVLRRIGQGATTEQIARSLGMTMPGVAERVKRFRFNLGAINRIHAFALAWNADASIRTTPSGGTPALTDRQNLLLRIRAAGGTRQDIERLLGISTDAAKALEAFVLRTTSALNPAMAVRVALEHGLISGTDTLQALADEMPPPAAEGPASDRDTVAGPQPPRTGIPGDAPTGHLANQLRTANGLVVHLDALADVPPMMPLAEILKGAEAVHRPAHVVTRMVHQALARGIPCALVIPPTSADPAKAAETVGLGSAWSAARHQSPADGTAAYAQVALDLGLQPETCAVVCTAEQSGFALRAGPQKLLITNAGSALTRTDNRQLTWRERQVAEQCARGLTDEQIGESLKISQFIVSNDLAAMRRKFGVHDRVQVVAHAIRSDLVDVIALRGTLPAELPVLDDAERAVLRLLTTRVLDAAGARDIGLTFREARNAHLRAVKKLSPHGRAHAITVALLSGVLDEPGLARP